MGCPEVSSGAKILAALALALFSRLEFASCTSLVSVPPSPSGGQPLLLLESADLGKSLSRKKRYINFPTGSLFGITICLAKRTLIRYPDFYTFNFDLDVGYKLPNSTRYFINRRKRDWSSAEGMNKVDEEEEASIIQHRRDRRAVYSQIEGLLEVLGLDGRECVLRTICEAKQVLPDGGNLMEDVLRALFSMPQLKPGMLEDFPDFDINGNFVGSEADQKNSKEYDAAHKLGEANGSCDQLFPLCTVSLLEVALW